MSSERFGLLSIHKLGGKAEGGREASMAAGKDNMFL